MDPLPLHVSDVATPTSRLAVGVVAGLLAAVLANVPMRRLPEGTAPPFVTAGALVGETLSEVDPTLASGVHYASGALGGALFTLLSLGFERALPPRAVLAGVGLRAAPLALATLCTYAAVVLAFGYVVLPLAGGEATARASQIRRDWVVTTAAYTVALVGFVVLLVAVV